MFACFFISHVDTFRFGNAQTHERQIKIESVVNPEGTPKTMKFGNLVNVVALRRKILWWRRSKRLRSPLDPPGPTARGASFLHSKGAGLPLQGLFGGKDDGTVQDIGRSDEQQSFE